MNSKNRCLLGDRGGLYFGDELVATGVKGAPPDRLRRIVACVNACEGYATEDVEACGVQLRDDNGGYAEIKEQRDALLTALETMVRRVERDNLHTARGWDLTKTRAAIASVKGGA